MHFFGEHGRISKDSVVVGLRIQFSIPRHEHPPGSAEAANIREQVQMIQRDLERLHASHREASHCAMIAISERPEGLINEWNQDL